MANDDVDDIFKDFENKVDEKEVSQERKKSLVKEIVDNGWFITASTSIVRSTQVQDNIKLAPINQIFCETDAPYLTPFKDKRNEPAFVAEAYKKLAEIKKMEFEEVINNVWMNWQKVFS